MTHIHRILPLWYCIVLNAICAIICPMLLLAFKLIIKDAQKYDGNIRRIAKYRNDMFRNDMKAARSLVKKADACAEAHPEAEEKSDTLSLA